jgi:hypothetical protein
MAIAFDAVSEDKTSATTNLTYAHTCSGTDRFLYVAVTTISKASPTISAVTYGGVSMTLLSGNVLVFSGTNWFHHVYYLANPASGSNNVSITANSGGTIRSGCVSYTGVDQSNPIITSNFGSGTGGTLSISLTTGLTGWWIVSGANIDAAFAAGSVTDTLRASYAGLCDIADSNNDETAQTASATMTYAGTREWGGVAAAIKPAGGGGGPTPTSPLMMMGVGV